MLKSMAEEEGRLPLRGRNGGRERTGPGGGGLTLGRESSLSRAGWGASRQCESDVYLEALSLSQEWTARTVTGAGTRGCYH